MSAIVHSGTQSIRTWFKASRLPSQSYIFLPLLAGQYFFFQHSGQLDWSRFALIHLYGLTMQLYIVYANDYADIETDRQNNSYTMFSGGSRVLVDGALSRRTLGTAAVVMTVLSILIGIVMAAWWGLLLAPFLILTGLVLLWMYSFRPVHLSYRGGGEWLQAMGVGVVLPLIGYYVQAGTLAAFPVETFAVIIPTQLACAMATAMPDRASDALSHKRTLAVRFGLKSVATIIVGLNLLSLLTMVLAQWGDFSNAVFMVIFSSTAIVNTAMAVLIPRLIVPRAVFFFVLLAIVSTLAIMAALTHHAATAIVG